MLKLEDTFAFNPLTAGAEYIQFFTLFLYKGFITLIDHDSGTTPNFKFVLNNFAYILTNLPEDDLIYSVLMELAIGADRHSRRESLDSDACISGTYPADPVWGSQRNILVSPLLLNVTRRSR